VTAQEIIGLCVALLVMLAGLVGSILPILPGTPIILLAAILHRLYFGPKGADIRVLILLGLFTLLSFGFDYLASMFGAKKLGATWRGILGAVVGGLVGIFFSLPGIILGPFIGAVLFELAGGRKIKPAARAGLGAFLGLIAGALGKLAICVVMIGVFTADVIYQSVA
jgi:uncharacterized protein YqgC (DUF456 family)